MNQHELLYRFDGLTITMVLLFLIILLNEIGFRIGRFIQHRTDAEIKTLTGSIQASILGLLALLLGFTFSMSMQRHDDRSQAVIEEANAIGTAALRVQLLPAKYQSKAIGLMLGYSSGLSGKRVIAPTVMVSFLIAMIVFIIIDLDRPRRGLIRVDQNSLLELHQQNGDYLPNRF